MEHKPVPLSPGGQVLFSLGSASFTMLERLLILYVPFYYLPPGEYGVPNLVPEETFWGVATILGAAFLAGRVLDAVADPLVAAMSDGSSSPLGRRKLFLLLSALPLAATAALVFFPPARGEESVLNGVWLGVMLCFFYIFFTAYVNPYLALISELGHTGEQRINLSTLIALLGLVGMVLVTVGLPELVGRWQLKGMEFRESFRWAVLGISLLSLFLLYLATFSFKESRNCYAVKAHSIRVWESLKKTYAVRPFRVFLMGEVFLQFAMNITTLGLMYYAVVLFKQDQRFMSLLAALTIGAALLSFPFVNVTAKKVGKKKVILTGALLLALCSAAIFSFSFNLTGVYYYGGLSMFALAGIPLAILTILINPTIADLARAEAIREGEGREAMFFGARAVLLKLIIALAGVVFAFLLSAFGKDIANPLGVQLSILAVTLASICGCFFFACYPEKEVLASLEQRSKFGPGQDSR